MAESAIDQLEEARKAQARFDGTVTSVRITYSDLHGIQRGKDVPLSQLENVTKSGLGFCWAIMGTDLRHTPVVGGEQGYPDFIARPDLSTLVQLPWEPTIAACLSNLERLPGHRPEPTDPRGAVRRATKALQELGYDPVIGPELEFFLLDPDPALPGKYKRHVDTLSMVYTVGPQADPTGFVRELMEHCAELGLGAFAVNHEFMNSQYEINLRQSDAVTAADRAFRLKAAVKDCAALHGRLATFIGKPFNDQGGSGTHIHLSLERDGRNIFDAPDEADGVGEEVRWFTAGVLEHAQALMAFLNPTINSYRRIVPDSLAPTHANWGYDNRTTFVRIPPERGSAARLEVRVGDGSANPYLGIASLLFAGLDGVRRKLEPPEPLTGDAYRAEAAGGELPDSLEKALDALEDDTGLCEAMGTELVETFTAIKRFEIERFNGWTTDWEIDEYLHHL